MFRLHLDFVLDVQEEKAREMAVLTAGLGVYMKSEIYYNNPNLSIVLPGPCQAKCDFCFWYEKPTDPNYLKRLEYVLDTLPDCFYQISLTGGEPTLSKYFNEVLDIVKKRKGKYTKIVLTTNAVNLRNHIDKVNKVVDFVNISRHHWTEEKNWEVFKTKNVPNSEHLGSLIKDLGGKVTFNCVVKPDFKVTEMHHFLYYSYDLGCRRVSLRVEHGSLDPVTIERYLLAKYEKVGEGGCPVCRASYFDVPLKNGHIETNIKYSVLEPKDVIDGIYELVLHSDGVLSADWAAEEEIELVKE